MNNDHCCICLKEMKDNDKLKILSCDHKLHFNCYKEYIKTQNIRHFIQCPLCRELNSDITIPGETAYEKLENICEKRSRCRGITKEGKRCKNKRCLLNYGYCNVHHKNILKEEQQYDTIFRYINHCLYSPQNWKTRVILIDICKKLLVKYNVKEFYEFIFYLYKCSEEQKLKYDDEVVKRNEKYIYEYYDLELPPDDWINECLRDKKLF